MQILLTLGSVVVFDNATTDEGKGRVRLKHVYNRLVGRGIEVKYTMLGELCILKKTRYDEIVRSKKGLAPRDGHLANPVRDYYPNLKTTISSDPVFKKAIKMAHSCYENKIKHTDILATETTTKKFRATVAGRKTRAVNVREASFEWFVDVMTSLKHGWEIRVMRRS